MQINVTVIGKLWSLHIAKREACGRQVEGLFIYPLSVWISVFVRKRQLQHVFILQREIKKCGVNSCNTRLQPYVGKRKQQIDCNRESQQGDRKSEKLSDCNIQHGQTVDWNPYIKDRIWKSVCYILIQMPNILIRRRVRYIDTLKYRNPFFCDAVLILKTNSN